MEAIKMESVNLQGVNDKLDRLIELVSVPNHADSRIAHQRIIANA